MAMKLERGEQKKEKNKDDVKNKNAFSKKEEES